MGVRNRQHNNYIMGLLHTFSIFVFASVFIIVNVESVPIFPEPISALALSGASGLVITGASGATLAAIPTAALVTAKALLLKKAILGGLLYKQLQRRQAQDRITGRGFHRRQGNYWHY